MIMYINVLYKLYKISRMFLYHINYIESTIKTSPSIKVFKILTARLTMCEKDIGVGVGVGCVVCALRLKPHVEMVSFPGSQSPNH